MKSNEILYNYQYYNAFIVTQHCKEDNLGWYLMLNILNQFSGYKESQYFPLACTFIF